MAEVSFFLADEDPCSSSLQIKSRQLGTLNCDHCKATSPQIDFNFGWTPLPTDIAHSHPSPTLANFVDFVLRQVHARWQCATCDLDSMPLADITVDLPILAHDTNQQSQDSPPQSFRDCISHSLTEHSIKRVRPRSTASDTLCIDLNQMATEAIAFYETIDILTDDDLRSTLIKIAALPAAVRPATHFTFNTSLYPVLCPLHHSHSRFRTRALSSSLYTSNATNSLQPTPHSTNKDDDDDDDVHFDSSSDDDDNGHRHRLKGALKRKVSRFTKGFKQMPVVMSLTRTGLYSQRYIEAQVHELLDSLRRSIAKGFSITQL